MHLLWRIVRSVLEVSTQLGLRKQITLQGVETFLLLKDRAVQVVVGRHLVVFSVDEAAADTAPGGERAYIGRTSVGQAPAASGRPWKHLIVEQVSFAQIRRGQLVIQARLVGITLQCAIHALVEIVNLICSRVFTLYLLQRALESLEAFDGLTVSALQFFVLALQVEVPLLQLVDILGLVIELLVVDLDLLGQIVVFLRNLSNTV